MDIRVMQLGVPGQHGTGLQRRKDLLGLLSRFDWLSFEMTEAFFRDL